MAAKMFSLKERIIVLTGGLGRLGRQYTAALAGAGARVAVFDTVAGRAPEPAAPGIVVLDVDVTDRGSIERGLKAVRSRWGVPHGLVNNAALDSPPDAPAAENGPFETYPAESWEQVMDVNVTGVFHCCQVIGGAMAEEGRGSIVNIGSIYGLVSPDQRIYDYRRAKGAPFFKPVAYSVSKSALLNLTRYLATYWAARNVRVNTLTLGGVLDGQDDPFLREYNKRVPLGRMARKDEYNGAVVFLLSDASSYMTGSNLLIDGGWTAW